MNHVAVMVGRVNRLHGNAFAGLLREFYCATLMSLNEFAVILFVGLPVLAMILHGFA